MYKPQIHGKGEKHGKGKAQFWHLSCGHGKRGNSGKHRVQSVEILGFPRKMWKISHKDFAGMRKAWKIKICILDNAIASNFISVDGRGKILTKDSAVYLLVQFVANQKSFFPIKSSQWGVKNFRLIQNIKQCR